MKSEDQRPQTQTIQEEIKEAIQPSTTVREGGHVVIQGYRPLAPDFLPSDRSGYAFRIG